MIMIYLDGTTRVKYHPEENKLYIVHDYKGFSIIAKYHPMYYCTKSFGFTVEDDVGYAISDYIISPSTPSEDIKKCGVVKYNQVFEGDDYPNAGDFYSIGNMAIKNVLSEKELNALPPDTNAEILAFLFGQSAMLMHKYKEEVKRNG